jgi:hypothetical protein
MTVALMWRALVGELAPQHWRQVQLQSCRWCFSVEELGHEHCVAVALGPPHEARDGNGVRTDVQRLSKCPCARARPCFVRPNVA